MNKHVIIVESYLPMSVVFHRFLIQPKLELFPLNGDRFEKRGLNLFKYEKSI